MTQVAKTLTESKSARTIGSITQFAQHYVVRSLHACILLYARTLFGPNPPPPPLFHSPSAGSSKCPPTPKTVFQRNSDSICICHRHHQGFFASASATDRALSLTLPPYWLSGMANISEPVQLSPGKAARLFGLSSGSNSHRHATDSTHPFKGAILLLCHLNLRRYTKNAGKNLRPQVRSRVFGV